MRALSIMGWKGAVAAIAIAATLGACSEAEPTHADDWPTSSSASSPAASSPTVSDTSVVCAKFREVAAGAFGESMSFAQIVDGLKEVGELGTTAANRRSAPSPSRSVRRPTPAR